MNKAFKEGFSDGIMGRESNNPYKTFTTWYKSNSYLKGYLDGKNRLTEIRKEFTLIPKMRPAKLVQKTIHAVI